jgi:hypothetical protein
LLALPPLLALTPFIPTSLALPLPLRCQHCCCCGCAAAALLALPNLLALPSLLVLLPLLPHSLALLLCHCRYAAAAFAGSAAILLPPLLEDLHSGCHL